MGNNFYMSSNYTARYIYNNENGGGQWVRLYRANIPLLLSVKFRLFVSTEVTILFLLLFAIAVLNDQLT